MPLRADTRSNSLTRAPSRSSPDSQPPRVADYTITNDESIDPISIEIEQAQPSPTFVQGGRLRLLTLGYQYIGQYNFGLVKRLTFPGRLWIALFLSTIETTIVSTALVSITDALHGFDSRDWIVTSYLLTYTGTYLTLLQIYNI